MNITMHPASRQPTDRRAQERELLDRALTAGPRELRRCWWLLYVQARKQREQEVRQ